MEYLQNEFGVQVPGDVVWAHGVNSKAMLDKALNDPEVMIIESDISISPNGQLIAVHPPRITSDLTLAYLIKRVKASNKVLKLDFKDPAVIIDSLQLLERSHLTQPVLLNADILQGNCEYPSKFRPQEFISLCSTFYPAGILSIGWTTNANTKVGYTQSNVQEMMDIARELTEVTFPVRAALLPLSWEHISPMMHKEGHTLSIWNSEEINEELMQWIKENTDPKKTFYDFTDGNIHPE